MSRRIMRRWIAALAICLAALMTALPVIAEEEVEIPIEAPQAEEAPKEEPAPASEPEPPVEEVPEAPIEPEESEAPEEPEESEAPEEPETPAEPAPEAPDEPVREPEEGGEPEGETAEEGDTLTITGFDPIGTTRGEATEKPALADVVNQLPATLTAHLSDGTTAQVAVNWSCATYDSQDEGDFVFTAALADDAYPLDGQAQLPTYTLTVTLPAQEGDFTYELNEAGELTITGYTGNAAELIIPETLADHPVVAIGPQAFVGAALTKVELPKGLKVLDGGAFAGCEKLESIVLPDSLERVEQNAFKNDDALKTVTLSASLLDRTFAAPDTLKRPDEEDPAKQKELKLPIAVTDLLIDKGALILTGDFTIDREHAVTVNPESKLTVAAGATLTDLGSITNNGELINAGTIVNCAGAYAGAAGTSQDEGTYLTDHQYESGKCKVCGAEEPINVKTVDIRYNGNALSKIYDKTRNVTLKASDFTINGVDPGHSVRISAITAAYDQPDAGNRTVTVSFKLGGTDAARYKAKDVSISATITPKALVITPATDQKKIYGASDPSYYSGKVRGLLTGDTMTGKLSREVGEKVGRYRILQGTISAGANYEVEVVETYFTIEPKNINSTDIGMTAIGNQRYTGSAVTPDVTLHYGSQTLRKDTDYTLQYADNVDAGTATVKILGTGNYTGERPASFRILNVAGGVSGSSGGGYSYSGFGGGSSGGYSGFDDDDDDTEEEDDGEEDAESEEEEDLQGVGELLIEDVNYGTVMFGADSTPRSFMQFEEPIVDEDAPEDAPQRYLLNIIAEPMEDPDSGETLYLEDGDREQYEELHLRLTPGLLSTLTDLGYEQLVYELEYAQLIVPFDQLTEQFEDPTFVASKEVQRQQLAETGEEEAAPVDDAVGEQTMDLAAPVLNVEYYDFCIEQAWDAALSDAESAAVADYYEAAPLYRVRVSAHVAGNDLASEDGTVVYEALYRLDGALLKVLPNVEIYDVPEDGLLVFVPVEEDGEAEVLPADFLWEDDILYAEAHPDRDGLYAFCVTALEGEEAGDDYEEADDEEEEETASYTEAGF